jgi:hypothetical protein
VVIATDGREVEKNAASLPVTMGECSC